MFVYCSSRFTEFYVDELEDVQDLKILVSDYLRGLSLTSGQIEGIVKFYLVVREEAVKRLTDGTGHRPHFRLIFGIFSGLLKSN